MTLRVGLLGLGAIGSSFVELVAADEGSPLEVVGALVRDQSKARTLAVPLPPSLDALLSHRPDVVAEAAGHEALRAHGARVLRASVPLVLLSVGALADDAFARELRDAAAEGGVTATIASGATGALDLIASAATGGLEQVIHTIVKPPQAFGIETDAYTELFRGPAREAAAAYPQNANIAAAVAIAGVGLDRSVVVVAADPNATTNSQRLEASGTFGHVRVEIQNRPMASNPRSGALVAMSLKHALERQAQQLVVG